MPKPKATMQFVVKTLAVMLMLTAFRARGGTILVPADAETIQQAIDSSIDLDTIIVSPGHYIENINFAGKNIILQSTDFSSAAVVSSTIIDGDAAGSVVTFAGTETSYATLIGFTITNGSAVNGGGINGNGASPTIEFNYVSANTTLLDDTVRAGGGVYSCAGEILGNVITGNTAGSGGGIAACSGMIEHNIIADNIASFGGGVYQSAGNIRNNLIYGNSAATGGGFANCSVAAIYNNTIFGNTASGGGGGLNGCLGAITNNIIYGNTAASGAQMLNSSVPNYCCVQGGASAGTGNISADPQFADSAGHDFHLLTGSPCIDAGTNTGLSIDFEGNARPVNGVNGTRGDGSEYDIGAYEAPSLPPSIAVQPTQIDYGSVVVFQTAQSPVAIKNNGTRTLQVTGISGLTGTRFSIVSGPTAPFDVAAGATVQLQVRFAPNAVTSSNAVMTISSNDTSHASVNVALSGTGVSPPCFIGQLPTYSDGIDLTAIVSAPKVKRAKTGGTGISGKFAVAQLKTNASGTSPTAGVPATNASIYLLDSSDACSLANNATPLITVPVKAGKPGKPGLPAKMVKAKFKTFTSATTTGKFLLIVVDPANQVHETDKTNNYIVVGPLL